MKKVLTYLLSFTFITQTIGQDTVTTASSTTGPASMPVSAEGTNNSPYKTSFKVDAPIIAAGVGLTYLGTTLIANKRDLTTAEVLAKSSKNLPFFDRGNAGFYSEKADRDSYIPFHVSFVAPIAMALLNGNERRKFGQVMVLYTETMAVTGTLFTMATGTVYRSRPFVYNYTTTSNNGADLEKRRENDSHRSFYAGHTAASASATFFMAQVFSDFNPDSKAKPYVWAVAAAIPAVVAYGRYKAGYHFLSDNVIGYVLGAGAGMLVPRLHRTKMMKNVSILPQAGDNYRGLAVTYHIK
jgi:membrane-associated phospholipid phosphatase